MSRSSRSWGTGSVSPWRGKWRARLPGRYGRKSLGTFDTETEAHKTLAAALAQIAEVPLDTATLGSWGEKWLKGRDVREGVAKRDQARWQAYIAGAPIASLALLEVDAQDVDEWLRGLRGKRAGKLAAQTKQNALGLLRQALGAACRPGGPMAGRSNPADGVTLGTRERARSDEGWTWMRQHEIDAALSCDVAPVHARLFWTVAIYSGLRAGELCGLRWDCVDFDRHVIHVRWSRGEPPKGGKPREVSMLAPVYEALRRWRDLSQRSKVRSHLGLVFPAAHGSYRDDGYDAGWSELREAAGITRRVRFHDLRHTCASHLLQGTWAPQLIARSLRLEEVRDWLGHRDIKTTQRYAHLCSDAIASLVRRDTIGVHCGSRFPDLNRGPTVYEGEASALVLSAFPAEGAAVSRVVSRLRVAADRAADAIARGDRHRDYRALDLVDEVAALVEALEAADVSGEEHTA